MLNAAQTCSGATITPRTSGQGCMAEEQMHGKLRPTTDAQNQQSEQHAHVMRIAMSTQCRVRWAH